MKIRYDPRLVKNVINGGHGTMQVNFDYGCYIMMGNRRLNLVQFHYHTPSEHTLSDQRYSMEVHLVHRDDKTGKLCVLGSLIEGGGIVPHPVVAQCLRAGPSPYKKVVDPELLGGLNPAIFIRPYLDRRDRPFIAYKGSLTTPPCSEGLDWFVFADPIYIPSY